MKQLLFIIGILALSSCKKTETTPTQQYNTSVTLSISGIVQGVTYDVSASNQQSAALFSTKSQTTNQDLTIPANHGDNITISEVINVNSSVSQTVSQKVLYSGTILKALSNSFGSSSSITKVYSVDVP